MQVESLKSQAKIDFFSKLSSAFLGSKTVENIRISSFIELNLMCWEHLCQRIRTDSCRKNFHDILKILGPIRGYQGLT